MAGASPGGGSFRWLLPDRRRVELLGRLGRTLQARLAAAGGDAASGVGGLALRLVTALVFLLLASGLAMVMGLGILLHFTPRGVRAPAFSGSAFLLAWVVATVVLLVVGYLRHRQDKRSLLDDRGRTDESLRGGAGVHGGYEARGVAGLLLLDLIGALGCTVFDIIDSIRHPEAFGEGALPGEVGAAVLFLAGRGDGGLPDDTDRWPSALAVVLDPAPDRVLCKRVGREMTRDGLLRERQRLDSAGRHFRETVAAEAGIALLRRFQLLSETGGPGAGGGQPPPGGDGA